MSRKDETCKLCNHPVEAHQPVCLVFMGDGEACECDGKEETPEKLTPEQRLHVAINDALADAFRRGELEGRSKVLSILAGICNAQNEKHVKVAIQRARRELAKWGGV